MKHIPKFTECRLSRISSNKDIFKEKKKKEYKRALIEEGHKPRLEFKVQMIQPMGDIKRKRNIIWFIPLPHRSSS